jgi:tripartite-type tricarboxylate transporter receptor subunit TctC
MKSNKSLLLIGIFLFGICISSAFVKADEAYPNKPIKIILGITPGASTDFLAREVARGLSERLKVPVIVENKPGANTIIATNIVAKSPPDGYTIYLTNIVSAINPWMYTNLPYDYKKDMKSIVLLGVSDNLFAVNAKLGINNAADMIAYAKKNPGKFSYGSSGVGSIHNLMMELIAEKAQIQINHIPYKGAAAAILDTLGGNINGYCGTISSQQEFVKKGDLKPLFVTSAKRSGYMPDVPTLAEAGLPPIVAGYWMGLVAPTGTPDAIINLLNKEVNAVLNDPANIKKLSVQAIDPIGGTPADMDRFYDSELKLWKSAVSAAKIDPIALNK